MRYLARLLAHPGQELHALDLAGGTGALGPRTTNDQHLVVSGHGDAGPQLDERAKAAYRERVSELRLEVAEAQEWHDEERAARVQAELDALVHELATAVGLGGRDRVAASPAERARVSVTRAIRSSLARISAQHADLGVHLDATIRTGTFCAYVPDPRLRITWRE